MNTLLVLNQSIEVSWEDIKSEPAENGHRKEEECLDEQVPSSESVNWYITKVIARKEVLMEVIVYHGKHDDFHKKLKQIGNVKHSHLL